MAVFDLEARANTARGVILEGTVLLDGQRAAALEALEAAGLGPIEDRVVVLTASDGAPWVRPRRPLLAVLAAPDGDRATDVMEGDPPLRRLARRGMELEGRDAT